MLKGIFSKELIATVALVAVVLVVRDNMANGFKLPFLSKEA
jgi:hypothetical protein